MTNPQHLAVELPATADITIEWVEHHAHHVTVDANRYGPPSPGQSLAEHVLEAIQTDAATPLDAAELLGATPSPHAEQGRLTISTTAEHPNPHHDPHTIALTPDLEPEPTTTTRTETHW